MRACLVNAALLVLAVLWMALAVNGGWLIGGMLP